MHPTQLQSVTAVVLVVIFSLLLVGCSTSGLGTTLTAITFAAEAATVTIPLLETTGIIPPTISNLILEYAASVSTAAASAARELASTKPDSVKAANVIAIFAQVAEVALPEQFQGEARSIILAIQAAVDNFLIQFKKPAIVKLTLGHGKHEDHKLSMFERHTLNKIEKRSLEVAFKARSLKK
jgi:uncharacterized lipoprotein